MRKIVLSLAVLLVGCGSTSTDSGSDLDTFARCLNGAGAHLYMSQTCPHCHEQLALFGNNAETLNYIDCYYKGEECATAEVSAVPTWIFADGSRLTGKQALATLSQKTKCNLPK